MTWNGSPREWKFREPLTKDKFNEEIRDRMNFLFKRPRSQVVLGPLAAHVITTSGSWVTTGLKGSIVTTGGDIMFLPMWRCASDTSASVSIHFDLWIDESFWAGNPSGIATAIRGAWSTMSYSVGYDMPIQGAVFVHNLAPGLHTFELFFKSSASGNQVTLHAGDSWECRAWLGAYEV